MIALPPIPPHLPPWQAPHLAWLASQGHPTRYTVPEGTAPVRADLYEADLTGAALREADLTGANLSGANLSRAYLHRANLSGAAMHGADLYEANLSGANLSGADLRVADLTWADLTGAYLHGAYLHGATGIAAIGPVGRQRRMIYAVAHDDGPMVQAGCWWGSVPDMIARIEADYEDDTAARDRYVAAVRAVAAVVTR
jgi:hypothetical protein